MLWRTLSAVLVLACIGLIALVAPLHGSVAIGGRCGKDDVERTLDALERGGTVRVAALVLMHREKRRQVFSTTAARAIVGGVRLSLLSRFWRRNVARVLCDGGVRNGPSRANLPLTAARQMRSGYSEEQAWSSAVKNALSPPLS